MLQAVPGTLLPGTLLTCKPCDDGYLWKPMSTACAQRPGGHLLPRLGAAQRLLSPQRRGDRVARALAPLTPVAGPAAQVHDRDHDDRSALDEVGNSRGEAADDAAS